MNDPKMIKLVASALCRAAGMDPDGGARSGYGWRNHETAAIDLLKQLQSDRQDSARVALDYQRAAGREDAINWLLDYSEQAEPIAYQHEAGVLARDLCAHLAPQGTTRLLAQRWKKPDDEL